MDPIARVIMGGLGLFVAWTLLRAWRSGVIYSRGYSFDVNDRPVALLWALSSMSALSSCAPLVRPAIAPMRFAGLRFGR